MSRAARKLGLFRNWKLGHYAFFTLPTPKPVNDPYQVLGGGGEGARDDVALPWVTRTHDISKARRLRLSLLDSRIRLGLKQNKGRHFASLFL